MTTYPLTIEDPGDLLPAHQDAEWTDVDGCLWLHADGLGWGWRSREDGIFRVADPEGFPWTEVL